MNDAAVNDGTVNSGTGGIAGPPGAPGAPGAPQRSWIVVLLCGVLPAALLAAIVAVPAASWSRLPPGRAHVTCLSRGGALAGKPTKKDSRGAGAAG